jgi:hypothetical protein
MNDQMSRRSALKLASGVGFLAALCITGCSGENEVNKEIKTGDAKPASESVVGKARKGKTAEPSSTQRIKGGGPE